MHFLPCGPAMRMIPAVSNFRMRRSILRSEMRCSMNLPAHHPLRALLPLQGVKAVPPQIDGDVVEQRDEPRSLALTCCLRTPSRLFASLIATRSLANSSHGRLSTAIHQPVMSQMRVTSVTRSSAKRAYWTWVYWPRRVVVIAFSSIRSTSVNGIRRSLRAATSRFSSYV
jgi:hypothetical protein